MYKLIKEKINDLLLYFNLSDIINDMCETYQNRKELISDLKDIITYHLSNNLIYYKNIYYNYYNNDFTIKELQKIIFDDIIKCFEMV